MLFLPICIILPISELTALAPSILDILAAIVPSANLAVFAIFAIFPPMFIAFIKAPGANIDKVNPAKSAPLVAHQAPDPNF